MAERPTIPERMGHLLHLALESEGMTQADLARAMGVTQKHVSHMVTGKSGAWAMYDYAAWTLGLTWGISLTDAPPVGRSPE